MKNRISRLNDELVNQIAAGEVVERPASVVKELVENSLDAGSTKISVLLKDGGREEIAILDDGHGIHPDDLLLSIERHATSKIHSLSDLESITSFGFRGEALAAISSVSDIEIRTRTENMVEALVLESQDGKVLPLRPLGAPKGTQIFVRKIFSRVPARLKFLRSSGTELSYTTKLFKELALSTPEVSFSLSHQGKTTLRFTETAPLQRFQEVLRPGWEPMLFVEENDGLKMEAFLSPPHLIQDRGELFIYVNQRIVHSKLFASAIRNAYLDALGERHDPTGVLYLRITPEWVDVNVHPQKLEVRCLRQDRIYQWLFSSIKKQLAPFAVKTDMVAAPHFAPNSIPLTAQGILTVLRDRYLVRENPEGIEVVNRPELNRRVWKKRIGNALLKGRSLPVPLIQSPKKEVYVSLFAKKSALIQLGFEFEDFGGGDVAFTSLPEILDESRLTSYLEKLPELSPVGLLAMHAIDLPIEELLEELKNMKEEFTSSEGKPILWRLPYQDLEKHFE